MKYTVTYEIEIEAETPKEAALAVEEILSDALYRPFLNVIDADGNEEDFDLELEEK